MFKNQHELFMHVWNTRPHFSEVSGAFLGDIPETWFFAHLLSKGAWPQHKLNPKTIMLMTPMEHVYYDQHTDLAKQNKEYDFVFKLADHLRASLPDGDEWMESL